MKHAALALLLAAGCSRERAAAPVADSVAAPRAGYRVIATPDAGRVDGIITVPAGASAADVIVWLDDVPRGKALSLARRYEIDHERNELVPRVQGTIAGGTLNVRNADDALHRARFTLTGARDSVLGVVEETGAGQVVPAPKLLARAGLVVVTCDVHPLTRGWIRVFDQPYFAGSDSAGRFAMDSVPPGHWLLRAWHPALGTRDLRVDVDSAGVAFVELKF